MSILYIKYLNLFCDNYLILPTFLRVFYYKYYCNKFPNDLCTYLHCFAQSPFFLPWLDLTSAMPPPPKIFRSPHSSINLSTMLVLWLLFHHHHHPHTFIYYLKTIVNICCLFFISYLLHRV